MGVQMPFLVIFCKTMRRSWNCDAANGPTELETLAGRSSLA